MMLGKPEDERRKAEETFKDISMARNLLRDEVTRAVISGILDDRRRAANRAGQGQAPAKAKGPTSAPRSTWTAWDEASDEEPDSPPWNSRTWGTSSSRFPTWASSSSSGPKPSSSPAFPTGFPSGTPPSRPPSRPAPPPPKAKAAWGPFPRPQGPPFWGYRYCNTCRFITYI